MTSLLMVHSQIRASFLQPLLFLSPENSGVGSEVMRSQWFAHDRVAKLGGMDIKSEQHTAAPEMTLSAYRQVQNQHSVCERRRLPCFLSLIVCVCVCVTGGTTQQPVIGHNTDTLFDSVFSVPFIVDCSALVLVVYHLNPNPR